MPEGAVDAGHEDVEAVRTPGGNRRRRGQDPAEALPWIPGAGAVPAVPERVIGAADEDVDPIRPSGDGHRVGGEHAPQRFPAPPGALVVPLVDQRVVGTAGEDVEPAGSPGGGTGSRGNGAAERFAADPRLAGSAVRIGLRAARAFAVVGLGPGSMAQRRLPVSALDA